MVSRCRRKNSLCHLVCVQASIDLQNIGTQLIICNVKSMRHQAEKIFMNKGCHLTLCLPPDKNLSYLREFPKTRGGKKWPIQGWFGHKRQKKNWCLLREHLVKQQHHDFLQISPAIDGLEWNLVHISRTSVGWILTPLLSCWLFT